MLIALILMTAAATAPGDVVISEIMYNPDGQTLGEDDLYEWIELCNLLPDTVQLAGMMLSDGGNQLFLDGFELQPMARVVVAADGTSFTSAYGAEVPLVSWDGVWTKLANSGDTIILYSASGEVLDEVAYSDEWGIEEGESTRSDADGRGSSLERLDLHAGSEEWNWVTSCDYACPTPDPDTGEIKCWGTPGE